MLDLSKKIDYVPLNPDLNDSDVPKCDWQMPQNRPQFFLADVPEDVVCKPPYICRNCMSNKYNLLCKFYVPAKKIEFDCL